jgi:hypothetical protein
VEIELIRFVKIQKKCFGKETDKKKLHLVLYGMGQASSLKAFEYFS